MKNFKALIREVHRGLRPGGLLLFCEYELEVYDAGFLSIPAGDSLPGISKALRLARDYLTTQGVNVYAWRDLPNWLPCDSSFWKENELGGESGIDTDTVVSTGTDTGDSRSNVRRARSAIPTKGFVRVHKRANPVPTAPWHPHPRLREVGALVQRIWPEVWQNMGSTFQFAGLSEAEAEETIRAAVHDIQHPPVRITGVLHTLFAFKIDPGIFGSGDSV